MKKLIITPNSRTPFWMHDLEYMQGGLVEMVAAAIDGLGLGRTDLIISGCEVTATGGRVSMTGGWCHYDGEMLPVRPMAATSYSGSNPRIKFTRVTSYDSEGDRQVSVQGGSGSAHVYKNDYLAPSLVSAGDSYRLAIGPGAWNLGERIANSARQVDSGTVEATVTFAGLGSVRYRQVGGVVQLCGNLFNDAQTGINGAVASGLPRPSVPLQYPLNGQDGTGSIIVGQDGTLAISTQASRVHIDHIVYVATPATLTDDRHYSTTQQQGGDV